MDLQLATLLSLAIVSAVSVVAIPMIVLPLAAQYHYRFWVAGIRDGLWDAVYRGDVSDVHLADEVIHYLEDRLHGAPALTASGGLARLLASGRRAWSQDGYFENARWCQLEQQVIQSDDEVLAEVHREFKKAEFHYVSRGSITGLFLTGLLGRDPAMPDPERVPGLTMRDLVEAAEAEEIASMR